MQPLFLSLSRNAAPFLLLCSQRRPKGSTSDRGVSTSLAEVEREQILVSRVRHRPRCIVAGREKREDQEIPAQRKKRGKNEGRDFLSSIIIGGRGRRARAPKGELVRETGPRGVNMEGTTPLPPSLDAVDAVDAGRPEPPSRGAQTGTKFPGDVAVPRRSSSPRGSDAAQTRQRDGTSTLALGGCGHDAEANTRLWTDVHLRFRLGATLRFSACSEGPEEDVQQAGDRPPLVSSLLLVSPLLSAATHTCIHAYTHLRS